ncbi:hypothetical protein [Maribacter sp. HTCC2170]|uniref:hypothetical protein n=1 Tax=Maribacter sp. (strain HTCC2170 / KCCM 42371) TaxID=313603 RepID=UPI00006B4709|nr:hypothetical protein [Maribacter sp. HTCC2170]EAR01625.1 hypothetical protein FB2170_13893 [Maribacter sp. HTCC2170]
MNKSNKNNDFKTPEGYFEGFTDSLLDRMSNDIQNESILPKKPGFKVPEGYFDSLNNKIQEKLQEEQAKVITINSRTKFYYYAAAAVAAVFLLTIGIRNTTNVEPTFDDLAKNEIEDYFENTDLGLSTFEIAEVIPVDDLEISDILDTQLNEDNIIDYLDDNLDTIEELNFTDYDY